MRVKVITWDEMIKQHGLDMLGNIAAMLPFLKEMEELMPTNRVIELNGEDNDYWIDQGYYVDASLWHIEGSA